MASSRPKAMVATVEDTYGVFKNPDALTEAILIADPKNTPVDVKTADRKVVMPYYGHGGQVSITSWTRIETLIEAVGSGTVGTAPGWGMLLRACGFAEIVTPGIGAEYTPVSRDIDSLSALVWEDEQLQKVVGLRGSVSISLRAGEVPHFKFNFTGMNAGMTDNPVGPGATLTAWQEPLGVCSANTSRCRIFGIDSSFYEFDLDFANNLVERDIPGQQDVPLTDRKPKGSIVIPSKKLSEKDFFEAARRSEKGAFELTHGIVGTHDGKIVGLRIPAMTIGNVTREDRDGETALKIEFTAVPVDGNDEAVFFTK